MHCNRWMKALCGVSLATALAVPALASTLSFEGVGAGTILFPGDSINEGGFELTATYSAGVVDTREAFGPGTGLDLAAPLGNPSQFFIGLNDAGISLKASDGSVFGLAGFDFAFVSALTGLFAMGEQAGLFLADYLKEDGSTGLGSWSFGAADGGGNFSFISAGLADMGGLASGIREVEFYACTFDIAGACTFGDNFSQFALDNIRNNVPAGTVPLPGTLALTLLALGLAGGLRARANRSSR